MKKLGVTFVSKPKSTGMKGCGKNWDNLCGKKI